MEDVHPHVNLGNVASVGGCAGDVNDGEGHSSTLSRVHVVGVGVVFTDSVVVGVATSGVAWWVSNGTWLTWPVSGLSVATFRRSVHTAEVEAWRVSTPVLVWVSGLEVSSWGEIRHFPIESELVRSFVIVGITNRGLSKPVAVEVVEVAVKAAVVVSGGFSTVVVAVPGWGTAATAVVGVCSCRHSWVVRTVRIVSFLAAVGDVPCVSSIVLKHDVVSVGDEVVLARSVVVARVSVSTSINRVGADLQVIARAQVGGQVNLVGGPTGGLTR